MTSGKTLQRAALFACGAAAFILAANNSAHAEANPAGSLSIVAPAEAAPVDARLHVWTPVPGLSTGVSALVGDNLEITVSAEMYQPGGAVWFRALVDGRVAEPSDVQFKAGNVNFDGVRSFTFVQSNVAGGQHLVEIQWLTGSAAKIRDRTLSVHAGSPATGPNRLAVAAATSGPDIVTSIDSYEDIPGLATSVKIDGVNTLAIAFSAEAGANSGRLFVRALVDGAPIGEIIFVEAGDPGRSGTRSFTFTKAALAPGGHNVKLQWRAERGVARMGDRTIAVAAVHAASQQAVMLAPQSATILQNTSWVDIAPSANFDAKDPVTNVAVTFSGEVRSSNGRLFLRALVDDRPTFPNDVTLIQGGNRWRSTSHTFVLKNVAASSHSIRVQAMVDPQTTVSLRNRSLRVLWKRRSGADFVQPYLAMAPLTRTFPVLVVCFDPVRPAHSRPSFGQIKAVFEGQPTPPVGLNVRDWHAEHGSGVSTLRSFRYSGCADGQWHVAPQNRQGDWYWTTPGGFEQMWQDALAAADPEVDFHAFDGDKNNNLTPDELLVVIVRPQMTPYGTVRGTATPVDGVATPLGFSITDMYLSSVPSLQRWNVGITAHEIAHQTFAALDLYGVCPNVSPRYYSIMDIESGATHLDPFHKMKNGIVSPNAIDLSLLSTSTVALAAVEARRQILLLYHPARVGGEYFLIENRFPGTAPALNYDGFLGAGAVVIWQIFEDRNLTNASVVCPGDVRFIRRIATLSQPGQSHDLAWSDGTPAGFRVSAPIPNAELAQVSLQKLP